MDRIILGLAKETKFPVDNRVLFTPEQVSELKKQYPFVDVYVESSSIRAFSDEEYQNCGAFITNDLSLCDYIFGIKEVSLSSLLPNKHYFFFGHIAKKQEYNRDLLKEMIRKRITFSDYEYLTNSNNERLCAFGWWAGAVGVYNTLRGYGLRTKKFFLSDALSHTKLKEMIDEVKEKASNLPKILITGKGKVSQGACYFLKELNIEELSPNEYLESNNIKGFTVLSLKEMVCHRFGKPFDRELFKSNPEEFKSILFPYLSKSSIFIPCHYWGANDPIYLSKGDLIDSNLRLEIIGDITCDINGGIKSTIKPTTHMEPYYDYNPFTGRAVQAFSDKRNITVMAVDTLPNALPREASKYFGEKFIVNVLPEIFNYHNKKKLVNSNILEKATILLEGQLTTRYSYLESFSKGE